jgi:PKD repeat protein
MRRFVPVLIAVAALLVLPGGAFGADFPVTIASTGFNPTEPVIHPGDSVTFTKALGVTETAQYDDDTGTPVTPRCVLGTDANCKRTFAAAGVFKFYDPAHTGCTSYATCSGSYRGRVIVDGPPTVTSAGAAGNLRGQPVSFTASATDPNGDAITSFNWDFGDGQTASTPDGNAQHTYAAAGPYTITVTATDARGNLSAPVQVHLDVVVPDSDADGVDDDHDACPGVPGVAPTGCPLPPPPPAVAPPQIDVATTAAPVLSLAGVLKSGMSVVVSCSSACNAVLALSRFGGGQLATGTLSISGTGGSQLVTLNVDPAARTALSKAKNPRLLLVAVFTDALGRTQIVKSSTVVQQLKSTGRLPALGISDQQATTFADPLFQVLRLKYARLVTPWNSIFRERARLDAWLQAAQAAGIRPLVSFEHARGDRCPLKPCRAPSTADFRKAWLAFHKAYPWVKDISPWDEVNSSTQPTGKHPEVAAAYYNAVRASCAGCTIVAADVLDAPNLAHYLYAFLAKAKGKPRLWGLHNYSDTNRFRQRGTRALLATVKGTVWFTETGGVVSFTTQGGTKALPPSEARAKKAMDYMFQLARLDSRRVKRIYVYQWKVNGKGDRFDAGIVRPDGSPRPSFNVLSLNAGVARTR